MIAIIGNGVIVLGGGQLVTARLYAKQNNRRLIYFIVVYFASVVNAVLFLGQRKM